MCNFSHLMYWNIINQPKNGIYTVVLCIQIVGRLLGFWPFPIANRINQRKNWFSIAILPMIWYIWSLITILLRFGSIYLRIKYLNPMEMSTAKSIKWANSLVITSIMILSTIFDILNRNNIRSIINKFDEFDTQV